MSAGPASTDDPPLGSRTRAHMRWSPLSLWSRQTHDACVSRACDAMHDRGMTAGAWREALRHVGSPRCPTSLPSFTDSRIENAYAEYKANETNAPYAILLCLLLMGHLIFLAGDNFSLASTSTTTGAYTGAVAANMSVLIMWLLLLAAREFMHAQVQLWLRTTLGLFLVVGVHVRQATNPSPLDSLISLMAWSCASKAAVSMGDVGWLRAFVFNICDSIATLLLFCWLQPTASLVPIQWEVMVTIGFQSYALYKDVQHRRGFIQVCEVHALRTYSRTSSQLHRHVVNEAPDMICVHTLPGMATVYVSRACEALLGMTQAAVRGRSLYDLVHPDDALVVRRMATDFAAAHAHAAAHTAVALGGDAAATGSDSGVWSGLYAARHASVRVTPAAVSDAYAVPLLSPAARLEALDELDRITDGPHVTAALRSRADADHGTRVTASSSLNAAASQSTVPGPKPGSPTRIAPATVAPTVPLASQQWSATNSTAAPHGPSSARESSSAIASAAVMKPGGIRAQAADAMLPHHLHACPSSDEVLTDVNILPTLTDGSRGGREYHEVNLRLRRYDGNDSVQQNARAIGSPKALRPVHAGPSDEPVFIRVGPEKDDEVTRAYGAGPALMLGIPHAMVNEDKRYVVRWRAADESFVPVEARARCIPEGLVCVYRVCNNARHLDKT